MVQYSTSSFNHSFLAGHNEKRDSSMIGASSGMMFHNDTNNSNTPSPTNSSVKPFVSNNFYSTTSSLSKNSSSFTSATTPMRKISEADRAGLVARSRDGHAARGGMNNDFLIDELDDSATPAPLWVRIQTDTFKNWINVTLDERSTSSTLNGVDDRNVVLKRIYDDLGGDFKDGTVLAGLVEQLQGRKLKRINWNPSNQHQEIDNIGVALDAIQDDGIKLVNIGASDINNGNMKLILGLIWSLIAHYQLGASNFPPKKLMLAWLRAVLHGCVVSNFTTDWNSGIFLSALINYCQPSLLPNWRSLKPENSYENCKQAMEMAYRHFNIPIVLDPEYLSSPHLDELSGMTYLSYFMKEQDSAGYFATLNWVKRQLPGHRINNFRTDWNDGRAACALVRSKGGSIPGFRDMEFRNSNAWSSNIQIALEGGEKLGAVSVIDSREMSNSEVQYLGPMAWVAQFQWLEGKTPPGKAVQMNCGLNKVVVGDECQVSLDVMDKENLNPDFMSAEITQPPMRSANNTLRQIKSQEVSYRERSEGGGEQGGLPVDFEMYEGKSGGRIVFTPNQMGMHSVAVKNDGELIGGSPHYIRVTPASNKNYEGIEPCSVGSTVEVLINPHHAAKPNLLRVLAYSPTSRSLQCPISDDNGTFQASFSPDEAGSWRIHVFYDGKDIENSPFTSMVFDPRAVKIPNSEAARIAKPGESFSFVVDASQTGWGDVDIDVVFENKSLRTSTREIGHRIYEVTFEPETRGKHRAYVYLNGIDVKGSPFPLRIGKDLKVLSTLKNKAKVSEHGMYIPQVRANRYRTHETFNSRIQNSTDNTSIAIGGVQPIPPLPPQRLKRGQKILNSASKLRQSESCAHEFGSKQSTSSTSLFGDDGPKTKEGIDLLPVDRVIAFDCPLPESTFSFKDLQVEVTGGDNSKNYLKYPVTLQWKSDRKCTAEFRTARQMGSYEVRILVDGQEMLIGGGKRFIPFKTFDVNNIKIQKLESEAIDGTPVDFEVVTSGSGPLSSLEVTIDNGKTNAHVMTLEDGFQKVSFVAKDKFQRHRIDIKYNGQRVPSTPLFVEVKQSHSLLRAPSLVAGKGSIEDTFNSKKYRTISSDIAVENNVDFTSSDFNTIKHHDPLNDRIISDEFKNTGNSETSTKKTSLYRSSTFNERSSSIRDKIQRNSTSYDTPAIDDLTLNRTRFDTKSPLKSPTFHKSSVDNIADDKINKLDSPRILRRSRDSNSSDHEVAKILSYGRAGSEEPHSPMNFQSFDFKRHDSEEIIKEIIPDIKTSLRKDISKSTSNFVVSSKKNVSPFKSLNDEQGEGNDITGIRDRSLFFRSFSDMLNAAPNENNENKSTEHVERTNIRKDYMASSHHSILSKISEEDSRASVLGGSLRPSAERNDEIKHSPDTMQISAGPKLNRYTGTASLCKILPENGNSIVGELQTRPSKSRQFKAGQKAHFKVYAPNFIKSDIHVSIISPEKRPHIPFKIIEENLNTFKVEFTTIEVGTYVVDVNVGPDSLSIPDSPLIIKTYDVSMIKVVDIQDGFVGQLCSFRVDASKAGEGQLEISINDGDVPNAVQVLGGGKCLVTYTPLEPITHELEVTFNGEHVNGSPFLCRVMGTDEPEDNDAIEFLTSLPEDNAPRSSSIGDEKVWLDLTGVKGDITINKSAVFSIHVKDGSDAELAVSVQGPTNDIPVQVTGNVQRGFRAEFVPVEIGQHILRVEYNDQPVTGTPHTVNVFDASAVKVSQIPRYISPQKSVSFSINACNSGDGEMEIFVRPENGRLASFRPTVSISRIDNEYYEISNDGGVASSDGTHFKVEFNPLVSGNHLIFIKFNDVPVTGSPFRCTVKQQQPGGPSMMSNHLNQTFKHRNR